MSDPELRLSDWRDAPSNRPSPWLVYDAEDGVGFVLARSAEEAEALYALWARFSAKEWARAKCEAKPAHWQNDDALDPMKNGHLPERVIGVVQVHGWLLAGYGVCVEGFEQCRICECIVSEDEMDVEEDCCDECAEEGRR